MWRVAQLPKRLFVARTVNCVLYTTYWSGSDKTTCAWIELWWQQTHTHLTKICCCQRSKASSYEKSDVNAVGKRHSARHSYTAALCSRSVLQIHCSAASKSWESAVRIYHSDYDARAG